MRLTTRSEYALLALILIARHAAEGSVTADHIAEQYGLSKKYLEQILRALKTGRYVTPRRGVGGGYRMARPPKRISVAEVIRLMDGALAPVSSVSTHFFAHSLLEQERGLLRVFKEIRDYISSRLEKLTLADLI